MTSTLTEVLIDCADADKLAAYGDTGAGARPSCLGRVGFAP